MAKFIYLFLSIIICTSVLADESLLYQLMYEEAEKANRQNEILADIIAEQARNEAIYRRERRRELEQKRIEKKINLLNNLLMISMIEKTETRLEMYELILQQINGYEKQDEQGNTIETIPPNEFLSEEDRKSLTTVVSIIKNLDPNDSKEMINKLIETEIILLTK